MNAAVAAVGLDSGGHTPWAYGAWRRLVSNGIRVMGQSSQRRICSDTSVL